MHSSRRLAPPGASFGYNTVFQNDKYTSAGEGCGWSFWGQPFQIG